jgi:hypothetical protein
VDIDAPSVYDSDMRTLITAPFATAEDTARILGVSKTRLKQLLRLAEKNRIRTPKRVAKNGASASVHSVKSVHKKSASLRLRAKVGTSGRTSKVRSGKGRSGAKA